MHSATLRCLFFMIRNYIRNQENELIGTIGISGDSSDNDEIAAVDAVQFVGLIAETG